MAGPENMAEGTQGPEGGSASVTAVAEKPDVVVTPQAPKGGFLRKIFGEGQEQQQVLVEPGEYRPPEASQEPSPDGNQQLGQASAQTNETEEQQEPSVGEGISGGTPTEGNDGDGSGGGPEGPRGPWGSENIWGPEFRELGINIAREIVRLEALPYEVKYNDQNGSTLNQLYRAWKGWVTQKRRQSYERAPFRPPEESEASQIQRQPFQPERLANLPTITNLLDNYNNLLGNPDATAEQRVEIEGQLSIYFQEARKVGLLDAIDSSLLSISTEISSGLQAGLAPDEIMSGMSGRSGRGEGFIGVEQRAEAIKSMTQRTFRALSRSNPEVTRLNGVTDVYIDLAIQRFALLLLRGIEQPPSIEGEFSLEIGDMGPEGAAFRRLSTEREIYWRPTWANYFEVTARTEEQFQIAAETFIQWMRTGLGKAPDELFQKVNGFKEAITSAGQRAGISEYTVGLRLELEALMGVIGADFSNEHYNAEYYKQFLTFVAKDEGPDRFVRLSRTARGKLAAILWKFDKDPRFELLFSPHGSRGQLMEERNPVEMQDLENEIKNILIAEVMGIEMKRYDPRDPQKRLNNRFYEQNLDEIARFKPDEDFKNLYEGFDPQEQERLYNELRNKVSNTEQRIKRIGEIQEQLTMGMLPSDLQGEDRRIYEELSSGKQVDELINEIRQVSELRPAERLALARLERARRIQSELERGKDQGELQGEDKIMYDEAKNAVTLAYELYGMTGEKAKREGAVFLVDRKNPDGNSMKDSKGRPVVEYIPIHWAEKFVHFAENWTKATYGGELDAETQVRVGDRKGIRAYELQSRVAQARRMAIWALKTYGFEAKLFDFTLLRDGSPVDPNTLGGYSKYGTNIVADNAAEKYRYAVPENPRILGYNEEGQPVALVFDATGKPIGLQFDEEGKAIIYDRSEDIVEGKKIVQARKRILFDNLKEDTVAPPMLLKRPAGRDADGTAMVEKVPVDFQTATHHIYSRWTGHPYWGYQEEDTGLALTLEAFEGARRIRNGQSRPEDEEPHATQLLIVDPTLQRVAHFAHKEGREDKIALAAVEDSYQGHWRITDELYQAFYPENGDDEYNRTAYVLQDRGGSTKEWFHARALAARWTDLKMRRLRTFIPLLSLRFGPMSEMWGAPGGLLDVFRMMGYKEYRMVGQFAFDKWVNQTGGAQDVLDSLYGFGSPQEKRSREGLGEKPTNDADQIEKMYEEITDDKLAENAVDEEHEYTFHNVVRESLGRFEVALQRMRVLESDMRGERAPLWLEGIDIFERNPDGSIKLDNDRHRVFNRAIDQIRDTGSSRHSGNIFFWRFVKWLRSGKPGEGRQIYPNEAWYYQLMDDQTFASRRARKQAIPGSRSQTRWDWLLGKIVR